MFYYYTYQGRTYQVDVATGVVLSISPIVDRH